MQSGLQLYNKIYVGVIMNKLIKLFLFSAIISNASQAWSLDFVKMNCKEYNKTFIELATHEKKEGFVTLISWLYGYTSALHDSTVIDQQGIKKLVNIVKERCEKDPHLPILTVYSKAYKQMNTVKQYLHTE